MYTISDINYTIAGPFLTLDFVYIVLTIVALLRFATVYQMKDRFALGLIFYLSIAIHCLYRVGTFQATTILSIDAINETDIRKISEITQKINLKIGRNFHYVLNFFGNLMGMKFFRKWPI